MTAEQPPHDFAKDAPARPSAPQPGPLPEWSRDELNAWLRLTLTPGVGNGAARRLLAQVAVPEGGSAQAIFRAPPAALRECVTPTQAAKLATAPAELPALLDRTWRWLHTAPAGLAHALLVPGDPRYPEALLATADPPLMLYVIGPAPWVQSAQALLDVNSTLAVVGSRHPTAQGADNARQFAREMAAQGWCVISGLAAGVDAAAHAGALGLPAPPLPIAAPDAAQPVPASPRPLTAAVIGTGIDRVYPAQHHALGHHIVRSGFILSEFPLGTPPLSANFPKRNRIISALACGTLVVEAALKSGSLITARLAAEQGREVFAIPGSIHAPQSRGCHALIRQGAKLVETAQDIQEELAHISTLAQAPQRPAPTSEAALPKTSKAAARKTPAHASSPQPSTLPMFAPSAPAAPSAPEHPLLAALGFDPVGLDALSARTGLDAATLQAQLLELELDGHVAALPGGLFQRIGQA